MIKKILPVMIGAALVGGMSSAFADVTAMGHIDTSFNSGKDKNQSNKTLNNLTFQAWMISLFNILEVLRTAVHQLQL